MWKLPLAARGEKRQARLAADAHLVVGRHFHRNRPLRRRRRLGPLLQALQLAVLPLTRLPNFLHLGVERLDRHLLRLHLLLQLPVLLDDLLQDRVGRDRGLRQCDRRRKDCTNT